MDGTSSLSKTTFVSSEVIFALLFVLAASFFIYVLGRRLSPKTKRGEDGRSTYACGERASFRDLRISLTYFKYLVYFAVLDSSALLVAFASLAQRSVNTILLLAYLSTMLVSGLLLLEGGDL
jgi:NADH:ubiquinone oxidoreductase subunit 3 (subunit A)